ncbi:MAG: hypothetical protein JKY13_03500 [Gammaproteobacteria bacterium]|nr:hypothetical protein [Gammaproteobacteria bacterium]
MNIIEKRIYPSLSAVSLLPSMHADIKIILSNILQEQQQYLALDKFEPHKAASLLTNWIFSESDCDISDWLLGFCLLAYSIMPSLSQIIWQRLGFDNSPHIDSVIRR